MPTRKTRGSRSPRERVEAAARSAAALLEDVPRDEDAAYLLGPIATVLRVVYGSADVGQEAAAEASFDTACADLIARLRRETDVPRSETNTELISELKVLLAELDRRLANYVQPASSDATIAAEGLAYGATLYRMLTEAASFALALRWRLEEAAVDHA